MRADLVAFLRSVAAEPFAYGRTDCALVIGRWWAANHGHDPTAFLWGAYHDEASCAALLASHGHLPRLVARVARRVGARRVTDPLPGDVAVVRHKGRWWGAIRTPGHRWAIKCGDGLCSTRNARSVAVWRV